MRVPNSVSNKPVQRSLVLGQAFGRQPLKQTCPGSHISSSTIGSPSKTQQASHVDDRVAGASARAGAQFRPAPAGADIRENGSRGWCRHARVRNDPQKAELRARLRGGWRRRCPCPAGAPAGFRRPARRLALRTVPWLTLKRVASSISLGISSPGFHSPGSQALHDQRLDLLIQRRENGRTRSARGGVGRSAAGASWAASITESRKTLIRCYVLYKIFYG